MRAGRKWFGLSNRLSVKQFWVNEILKKRSWSAMSHGLYILSIFFHILAACMWLGGVLFLILVFVPGLKKHPDKVNIIAEVSLKFRTAGVVALAILLITGIVQLNYRGVQWTFDFFTHTQFGRIAGLKILVFAGIVAMSIIHDYFIGKRAIEAWRNQPQSPKTIKLRKLSRLLGRINFVLAVLAVFLGVILIRGW